MHSDSNSNGDDDQHWLDALAGHARPDSPAAREAAALRDAIVVRVEQAGLIEQAGPAEQVQDTDVRAQDPLREAQLIARARREGLIEARRAGAQRWWSSGWDRGFAVAAIAGLAIAIGWYVQSPRAPEIVRSSPDGIVRLQADNPAQLKQQLLEDLRAAGVEATGYELLGRQGVDADLPRPMTDAVRRVLHKYRIAEPADGVLRVEITTRGPK